MLRNAIWVQSLQGNGRISHEQRPSRHVWNNVRVGMALCMELFESFPHDASGSSRICGIIVFSLHYVILQLPQHIPGGKFLFASNRARNSVASSLKTSRLSDQLSIVRKLLFHVNNNFANKRLYIYLLLLSCTFCKVS